MDYWSAVALCDRALRRVILARLSATSTDAPLWGMERLDLWYVCLCGSAPMDTQCHAYWGRCRSRRFLGGHVLAFGSFNPGHDLPLGVEWCHLCPLALVLKK